MIINTTEDHRKLINEIEIVHDTFTDTQLAEEMAHIALHTETYHAHAILIEAARRLNYRNG